MNDLPKCLLCGEPPSNYENFQGVKHHCSTPDCTLHLVLFDQFQWRTLMGGGEAVAWLVTKGRIFKDRAFISKQGAENSRDERNDGAVVVPLYTTPQPQAVPDGLTEIHDWLLSLLTYPDDYPMDAMKRHLERLQRQMREIIVPPQDQER